MLRPKVRAELKVSDRLRWSTTPTHNVGTASQIAIDRHSVTFCTNACALYPSDEDQPAEFGTHLAIDLTMSGSLALQTEWTPSAPKHLRPVEDITTPALMVGPDADWVMLEGNRIDLRRHAAPRRIFAKLCEETNIENDTTLKVGDLFEAGWPGEKIRYESRVKRVHTAIWTLRKLGLVDVLQTEDRGYRVGAAVEFAS